MAGIGAIVWGHLGSHGQLWALGAAVVVPGLVGALVALPALRLSGIYLALGTAAFAVVLDRWIFTMPAFDVAGVRISLFDQASLDMAPPRLLGWTLDGPGALMVFAAVWLALASIAVAWLRRGRFGRQLIALRDSEAAYATLGGKLVRTKVMVFALAAGIAGLGGALYGMQQQAVTASQFDFLTGLPLFLIAVIGGLGSVGSGLFGGAALVVPVNAIVAWLPSAQNVVALLPGLAGIGLGRSPGGIVAMERRNWGPIGRDRAATALLLAGLAAALVLQLGGVLGGWPLLGAAVVFALAVRGWATSRSTPADADVPLEWRGIRRAWVPQDEEVVRHAGARG
jgi:branched-chain amino acid transport system permease protein